jgi:hypothetical protein
MTKYKLTKDDLLRSLKEQLYFLDSSLSNYSKCENITEYEHKVIGVPFDIEIKTEIEAKRIATIVRILLHDTSASTSLVKLLGIKENISYLDTSAPNDKRLHSMSGMHGVRSSNSDQYFGLVAKVNADSTLIATPLYEQHLSEWYSRYLKLNFLNWWQKEIINSNGCKYTREDLILKVANKDGGAHIQNDLPTEYYLTKKRSLSLNIQGLETEFEGNVVYASIAQIGWELLNSIDYSPNNDFIL